MTDETAPRPTGVLEVTRELVDNLVAFVRARLDEMEQRAKAVAQLLAGFDRPAPPDHTPRDPLREFALSHGPRQELDDVDAMRRLLDHLLVIGGLLIAVSRDLETLLCLASRWRSHPDFQQLIRRHARPVDGAQQPAPEPAKGATDA